MDPTCLSPSITLSNGRGQSAPWSHRADILLQRPSPVVLHGADTQVLDKTLLISIQTPVQVKVRRYLLVEHFVGFMSLITHRLTHYPAGKRKKEWEKQSRTFRLWLVSDIKILNGTGSRPSSNEAEFKWNITDKSKWRKINYVLFFSQSQLSEFATVTCSSVSFRFLKILIFNHHSFCFIFAGCYYW